MSIRPILIHPDPKLRKTCVAVSNVTDEVISLTEDMLETMYDAPGVGLAAPQLGVLQRVITLDCSGVDAEPDPLVMINPEVLQISDEENSYDEGCLSVPDIYETVIRPKEVRVGWVGVDGNPVERDFDELWATCVQHEIDHLNGKMFLDYLSPMKRRMITAKMKKLKKEILRG